ncbi:hypothetical protein KUCAC02_001233 [Chaenocephalus aceratus]|uniref:Uncharacterized protein n=1 Tax=Chaenocephalus aceratus TaxID=36190 RepID=A0ACB9XWP0_CHAAC|nr:hypothetical protein KUCAC02_001233 [Chaenocephalus aceratus]
MIRWHADRYENRKYAKRVLMFAIAQPLALSSRPFDVASNLHNAARGANGGERLLGGEESSGCRTPPVSRRTFRMRLGKGEVWFMAD